MAIPAKEKCIDITGFVKLVCLSIITVIILAFFDERRQLQAAHVERIAQGSQLCSSNKGLLDIRYATGKYAREIMVYCNDGAVKHLEKGVS